MTRTGRFSDAESFYRTALSIDPTHERAAIALSMLYLTKLPNPKEAESLVAGVLARNPKQARAWFLKAVLAYGKDEPQCRDALEHYLQLVDRNDLNEKPDVERAQRRLAGLKR